MIEQFYISDFNTLFGPVVKYTYVAAVIFLPFVLGGIFWENWVTYVRTLFYAKTKFILLELRLPKEQLKSPVAMELFITSLYQTGGEGNWFQKYWLGMTRPWYTLELVSIGGTIHFYIWARENNRRAIESQIYAQYPEIEVHDTKDYTEGIFFDPESVSMFACDFKKTGDSHLPIKTYVDFGLDKDPEEEVKIDPITPTIEFLGSLQKGESVWIQILLRAHKKEQPHPEKIWYKPDTWKKGDVDWKYAAMKDIEKRMKRDKKKDGEINMGDLSMTKGERGVVEAIERSISKLPFDCAIRGVYISTKDAFNFGSIGGMTGSFKQYGSLNQNGFAPANTTSVDMPWHDWRGKIVPSLKRRMLQLYKDRSVFYGEFLPVGYKPKVFVMSTEEIATIFHFPGSVSRTPTFERIGSKKAEPPANLPI